MANGKDREWRRRKSKERLGVAFVALDGPAWRYRRYRSEGQRCKLGLETLRTLPSPRGDWHLSKPVQRRLLRVLTVTHGRRRCRPPDVRQEHELAAGVAAGPARAAGLGQLRGHRGRLPAVRLVGRPLR